MNDHSPLRSAWTESLERGQAPNAAALRAHLRAVHRDHAGFTETCARACRDAAGRTSYDWLAEVVPEGIAAQVLDLACGSGPLLKILHDRKAGLRLTGVDMCPEELALARAQLPVGAARLMQAEAQDMAQIPDGSVDAVLCHWALTLMDPVAPVLDEVRRVLAPGGRFAALVDGPMEAAPGYAGVHDLIYGHVQAELPGYGVVDLGDPRVRGADSLSDLVRAAFPDATVTVETGVVAMEGPANDVAEAAAGFFYAAFILSPARRVRMLADLAGLLAIPGTAQGRFAMPINRLLVTT
ncbi:class I SAM-dependent methyltransferase [Roseovarius sp. D22-M7]|uniref:class I SAM-dependent methyltransferase n=1 Tax=Roseovarius sp. D22-M7 TaxID=3127116 RepID=UPI0030105FE8